MEQFFKMVVVLHLSKPLPSGAIRLVGDSSRMDGVRTRMRPQEKMVSGLRRREGELHERS
jgi:hypothetical protein